MAVSSAFLDTTKFVYACDSFTAIFLAVAPQAILYVTSTSTFTVVGDAQQYGNLFGVKPLAVCYSFSPIFNLNADNRGLFLIDLDIFTRQLMSGSRQYPDIVQNVTVLTFDWRYDLRNSVILYATFKGRSWTIYLHTRLHFTTSM